MVIAICSDHAGLRLKEELKNELILKGYSVKDFGTHSEESCDYPDFAFPCAESVANGECEKGILICGTGVGMSICANKVKGIRCALCGDLFTAKATRQHNDANMLALGARVTDTGKAVEIADVFLNTAYEGGRHRKRLEKIAAYEEEAKGI